MSDEPIRPTPPETAAPAPTTAPTPAPTDAPAPAATDTRAPEAPLASTEAPAPPASGTRRAKPITSTVLRAAARTPKDVREIVELESKVKEKRQVKAATSVFASAVEASRPASPATPDVPPASPSPVAVAPVAAPPSPSVASPPAPTPRPVAAPPPQPTPLPRTPRPLGETQRAVPPVPSVPPAPPIGRPVVPAPPVPRPSPATVVAPAAPAPQVVVTAPRSSSWPVVLALLTSAGISAGGLYLGARLVADALATARQASAVAPTPPPPVAPPAPTAGPGGQLAPIGADRVIYTTAEGHLLVLRPDPASGELEVERAYSVSRDLERHLGEDSRQLHGYYLDDIEAARRAAIEAAQRQYELSVVEAGENRASVASAKAAAVALVRAGGADRLARDLAVEAGSGVSNMRRRTAALALGESGYVAAAPLLLELLETESGDLQAEAAAALERLSGLKLDVAKRAEAVAAVKGWLERRAPGRPFDRAAEPRDAR